MGRPKKVEMGAADVHGAVPKWVPPVPFTGAAMLEIPVETRSSGACTVVALTGDAKIGLTGLSVLGRECVPLGGGGYRHTPRYKLVRDALTDAGVADASAVMCIGDVTAKMYDATGAAYHTVVFPTHAFVRRAGNPEVWVLTITEAADGVHARWMGVLTLMSKKKVGVLTYAES